jgi:hypothetical protein
MGMDEHGWDKMSKRKRKRKRKREGESERPDLDQPPL